MFSIYFDVKMVQSGAGRCGKLNLESLDAGDKMISADNTVYAKVVKTRYSFTKTLSH